MPIYQIQDDDRPMVVWAAGFSEAIQKWREFISKQDRANFPTPADVGEPTRGVIKLCEEKEFIP